VSSLLNSWHSAEIHTRILYPAEFRVPADSDYDDQEDDFEPVDTDLMPLIFQDMKLRLDYVTAPPLVYVLISPYLLPTDCHI